MPIVEPPGAGPEMDHGGPGFSPTCWICLSRDRDWAVKARSEANLIRRAAAAWRENLRITAMLLETLTRDR